MVGLWVGIRVPMRQQPSLPISSITEISGLSQFSSCLYDPCPEDHLSLWLVPDRGSPQMQKDTENLRFKFTNAK